MRIVAILSVVLLLLCSGTRPQAQADEMIAGQVTKIDPSAQKITIKHGPIKKFDMDDGMTMVFYAPDPSLLKGLKAGDKIRFAPDRINGQFAVTKIEKSK